MMAIAIFVKTPGHSSVKTRLVRTVGRSLAEEWHRQAASTVAAVADAAKTGPVYWAVAEDDALDHLLWRDHPAISQGSGSLGERMANVHNRLVKHHGRALLLGADAPQLDPAWLKQAADWLIHDSPRTCIGPARDGGFWTFGANRCIDMTHWQAVTYSSDRTLTEFRHQMSGQGECLDLPELTDLDVVEDVPELIAELRNLVDPHPRQVELLRWIERAGLLQDQSSAT